MKRILLDQNVPVGVRRLLPAHLVSTAYERGWAHLSNGRLLAMAEDSAIEVLITCDQNLRHQQNLAGRRLAILVLTTNRWMLIRAQGARLHDAVEQADPGSLTMVECRERP